MRLLSRLRGREGGESVEFEEHWTGSYIFENEWQSFRTRKNRDLEFISTPHFKIDKRAAVIPNDISLLCTRANAR